MTFPRKASIGMTLVIIGALAPGISQPAAATGGISCRQSSPTEVTCVQNNAPENFYFPAGVTTARIRAVGENGSMSSGSSYAGGRGGIVTAEISVNSSQTYLISQGEGGGLAGTGGGAGGGFSGFFVVNGSLKTPLVIAGGGGGVGYHARGSGGDAGAVTGGDGAEASGVSVVSGGGGGTQTAGGAGGALIQGPSATPGSAGSYLTGGNGETVSGFAGGGGAGLYGGGGGGYVSSAGSSGGGGSSLVPDGGTFALNTTGATPTLEITYKVPTPVTPTVTLTSSANPSVSGQQLTFTTTVSGPNGTPTGGVSFAVKRDGQSSQAACNGNTFPTVPLDGNGVATCRLNLAPGTVEVTTQYVGNAQYNAVTTSLTQTINRASSKVNLTTSPTSPRVGQTVTLSAAVSVLAPGSATPTGTVAFKDGSATISGCSSVPLGSSPGATCSTTFTGGSHSITAAYNGDPNVAPSSAAATITVQRAASKLVVAAPVYSLLGIKVSATLTAAGTTTPLVGRRISFTQSNGRAICSAITNANGTATCIAGAGVALIVQLSQFYTASFAGDGDYLPTSEVRGP